MGGGSMTHELLTLTPIDAAGARDDWSELVSAGESAAKDIDAARWQLGYLASRVERAYGDESLKQYAHDINVTPDRLYAYQRVYVFYGGNSTQVENLTWSHFREALRLKDRALALRALAKAADRDWTVGRLGYFITRYLRRWHGITPHDFGGTGDGSAPALFKTVTARPEIVGRSATFRLYDAGLAPGKTYRLDIYEATE